jgi:deoxyadenosine/deoxycytidine kinase
MRNQALIIEVAGPAGAGKSTITKALRKSNGNIQIGTVPSIRNMKDLPFFLWNTILLVPIFFTIYRNKKQGSFARRQIVNMAILNGWHQRLQRMDSKDRKVIILDQGPAHILSDLLRFGPKNLRSMIPRWWNDTCQVWAHTLDIVICLDAPDQVLLNRIRSRAKNHGCKNETDDKAIEFLRICRATQEETLSSMHNNSSGPDVVCLDTSQISLDGATNKILSLSKSHLE